MICLTSIPTLPRLRLLAGTARLALLPSLLAASLVHAAEPDQGATQLPSVNVRADKLAPTSPYAGGQLARASRVGLLGARDFMDTPFNTTSYTAEFIDNIQAPDLVRVIALTDPSVYSSGSSGGITDYFNIRGFGVASSDIGFGGLYGLIPYYRVTPELAERVEVLKGPSALLNGMPPGGSVGGAVNLVPKRADDTPLTRFTASHGSDAQFGGHLDIGRRFGAGKQFGVRLNAVHRDGDTATRNQQHRSQLASLGLDWRGERSRVSMDLFASRDHVDGLNRGVSLAAGLAVPRPPKADTLFAPDWTFSNVKDQAAALRWEFDINEQLSAHAAYGHGRTDFDSIASGTTLIVNSAGDFRNNFAHQRFIYSKDTAEAGLSARFRTGPVDHALALSAAWYHHDYKFGFQRNLLPRDWLTNIHDPQWGPAVDRSFSDASLPKTGKVRTTSVGIADTLSFAGDRLQLTVGIRRQTVLSDTLDGATGKRTARYDASANTPAGALLFKASERLSLYANYIEGLSQGTTAPVTAANAGEVFPPYKTRQREIGAKMDFGQLASAFSVYEIEKPGSYTDPASNVFSFGGQQRNRGVEWTVFGQVSDQLRLLGGIGWLQPKLTRTQGGVNERRLATATPQWQGKLGAEWDVPTLPGLTLTGNAISMSKGYITADNSQWVPGRTVFDLGARYATQAAGHPLVLRASVQNLTNKAYWAGSLGSGLGSPRTALLSATVDF
ncbi:TonB-dependent siderophore receptor [Stenotrophomonas lactitubi]|uniref:TonB-dependent receptor n=1 Tax=Stenotrophomonas lactitubi TaxID=2045214 RepID=UPI003209734D